MPARDKIVLKVALGAALVCFLVYLPALFCDFINWDDPDYIIYNPGIRLLDRQFFKEAFTTSYMGWWMPLTWISFAIDYRFWGLDPFGYHLTNVLLHSINAGLVVLVADRLLNRMQGAEGKLQAGYLYPATLLLAGLLWALHPLRVESVVWVTERKDVLNGIFSLAAILCYLRFARIRDTAGHSGAVARFYILTLLFLLLSLMSKPVSVVLPAMFLVADWYPLKRFRKGQVPRLLLEKVPFGVLVIAASLATIYFAAESRILVPYQLFPLSSRFLLAGNSLFEYCRLTLYPVNLIHIYLMPWPLPASYAVKALLVAVFSGICAWQYKKNPWLPATWLAFILPLAPVLGFFQNGMQSHAARFTYLPSVATSICAAALTGVLYRRAAEANSRLPRLFLTALVAVTLLICTVITERHLAAWKNSETLWSRSIAIKPVGRAYYQRADYYLQKGRYLEAADDLRISIDMGKKAGFTMLFNLHALRGDAFSKAGRYEDAVSEFTEAIMLDPYPGYYYHRGRSQQALGNFKQAEADFLLAGGYRGPIEWRGSQ